MKRNIAFGCKERHWGRIWMGALSAFLLLFTACGDLKKDGEDSSLKWGHLRYASSAMLVNVLPNETISICGAYQSDTKEAIEYWAQQIDRKGHLKFDLNCGPGKKVNIKLITQAEMCAKYGLAANCTVRGSAGGNQITLVAGFSQNRGALLHEVGHLWGMCDQYGNPTASNNNCDSLHRSETRSNGTSSMGATFKWELASDDIKGIREIAARTDIRANIVWQQYTKSPKPAAPNAPAPAQPAPSPAPTPDSSNSYVAKNSDGSVTFTAIFPTQKKYVEVFATRNGIQNVANAMQESRSADGKFRYSHTVPGYKAGDLVRLRFYIVELQGTQSFVPGPGEQVWTADYRY